jgi:ABC-2 type transport system ATP-binding protein
MSVITIKNLVKKFGKATALCGFNLDVKAGEIHGFLGPNGAGKSTTIRIILGLLRKTSGEVKLFGDDPWKNATNLHAKLAYVPGDVNFWPNLTGGEIIDLLGNLRGGLDEQRRRDLLDKFQLDAGKKFRTYSKGNRQKVALVAALASDVPLYILDEPTSGLDPLMEQVFQDEIRALKQAGKTILLSSHILSEAEALCDRVTIIKEGQTVAVYTLHELKKEHANLEKLFLSKYEEE